MYRHFQKFPLVCVKWVCVRARVHMFLPPGWECHRKTWKCFGLGRRVLMEEEGGMRERDGDEND